MKIPSEYLKEKNYEGTRLVEITDPKVLKLQKEIAKFSPIMEPHLKVMMDLSKKLDPVLAKIRELDEEKKKLNETIQKERDLMDKEMEKATKIEQKADLIKMKVQPLVFEIMKDQLGEFETSRQLIVKDDKLFVEVIDEIEEKVKVVREVKAKK